MRAPRGIRFRPPPAELSPALTWLLRAAFGPPAEIGTAPPEPAGAAQLARSFDLASRIAARLGADRLAATLGPEPTRLFLDHQRATAALELALRGAVQTVAGAAAEMELPVLVLKGLALYLDGAVPPASRPAADLDLLAPARRARSLHRQLETLGFRQVAGPTANEQHLPAQRSPDGAMVEIHFRLRGVDLGEGEWAEWESVRSAALARPAPELGEGIHLPDRRLNAAHLLAHAIEQHGFRPATYPFLRLPADLIDLRPRGVGWQRFVDDLHPWIAGVVSAEEAAAVGRLCDLLERGDLPRGDHGPDGGALTLLRHAVAGVLDPSYRAGQKRRHTLERLRTESAHAGLLRYISRKLGEKLGGSKG